MDDFAVKTTEVEQTKRVGQALGACLHAGDVVLLTGDLGAGKTQFVQGVARALGVPEGEVTSPTFNILFTYRGRAADGAPLELNHFDLYRLEKPEDLVDIDFTGVLESGGVCFIEWAEKFPDAMPDDHLAVQITADESGARTIAAHVSGLRSQALAAAWRDALSAQGGLDALSAEAAASETFGRSGGRDDVVETGQREPAQNRNRQIPGNAGYKQAPGGKGGASASVRGVATPDAVLAFDTSNEVIAIGLGRLDAATRTVEPIATRELEAHRASNTKLLPAIDALMREAGLSRERVACVACGRGPGSFTGVRICLATAKGVAMALEVPLWGLSTPDAVAWGLWAHGVRGDAAVVADAMRKEVYPVRYAIDDAGVARGNADVVVKAADGLPYAQGADVVAGDGLAKYAEIYGAAAPMAPRGLWTPTGTGLLLDFQARWHRGQLDPLDAAAGNPAFALPVYTRLSDAEENERARLADTAPRDLRSGVQHAAAPEAPEAPAGPVLAYRPLDAAHAADVARLEAGLMGTDAWNEAMVLDELPRGDRSWWAAFDAEGALVGYAGALVVDGDMQILKVATVPALRRTGVATALLAHVAEDARALGAAKASLEVRVGNAGAIRFYEHLGFRSLGRRPHYYSDREDAFILEGPLPVHRAEHAVGGMKIAHLESSAPAPAPAAAAQGEAGAAPAAPSDGAARAAPADGVAPGDAGKVGAEGASPAAAQAVPAPERPLLLAIESSCDETAAAVIDGTSRLHSDVVASQIDFHARFGGVVPEIASRKHIEAICGVVQEGLDVAAQSLGRGKLRLRDLDGIAATYAPGLVGALVVGVAFAKGAAWGADIPFIRVNHLEGHLYANKVAAPDIEPPMVVSLVSGGHTMLVHVRAWGDYETMGSTIDDAVGEAFDKVSKALGLGYPGGPVISKLAAQGNPKAVRFPRAMMHSGDLRFSLSGLKTAVITYIHKEQAAGHALNLPDIAASFQQAVVDVQVAKARTALRETGAREFCLGGGVAANPALREAYRQMCRQEGVRLTMPPLSSCTDNAGMIALVALDRYAQGEFSGLDADVQAHAPLDEPY